MKINKSIISIGLISLFIIGAVLSTYTPKKPVTNETNESTNSQIIKSNKKTRVTSQEVIYYKDVKGYYVHPEDDANYPGVVMVHEWWGLNDQIKSVADELAKEGYQVLAVDLYNGKVASSPDEARAQTSALNQEEAIKNMRAAVDYINDRHAPHIATLGWCFGGGQTLQLSLSGQDLAGAVIYYGNLTSDKEKLKAIKWPILGIFGDKDTSISVYSVKSFENALNELGIENDITIYPGVGHAFANPTGQNFAPTETKDAWKKTLEFLEQVLKK